MTKRDIKYNGKDFDSYRSRLIEFAKNYFPDSYADFSATSPGMMFMEMAAYVGDILSFYQDIQVQETFLQYAKNPVSLYNLAYLSGYRPKVTTVAETELTISQEVGATSNGEPNWEQACRIAEYSSVVSEGERVSFLLKDPVDFRVTGSYMPEDIQIRELDEYGNPETFCLTKKVKAFSGEVKTYSVNVGTYQKFFTFELPDENIVGIIEITDSDGNTWTEVPFLGQDTIFQDDPDLTDTGSDIHVLRLQKVSRRFVSRVTDRRKVQVQFGAGMITSDEEEKNYLPNPVSLEADIQELSADRYDQAYDPSNFLFSKSYGLAPTNTTLTVKYITGGGLKSNVPANSLTRFKDIIFTSNAPSIETILVTNEEAATGGRDGDTVEEIRQNSIRAFAEQKRLVTLADYNIRALSLPSKYGNVKKVYASQDIRKNSQEEICNPLSVSLYVLSQDRNGNLIQASDTVKQNLQTYLSNYLMVTDTVVIRDAHVINIGIQYDITLRPNFRNTDVLINCNKALKKYLSTDNRQINEPINLSEIYTLLDSIPGVQTVKCIQINNKVGEGYSKFAYDTQVATTNRILYPSYDPSIFEVKYPDRDIEGRVVGF